MFVCINPGSFRDPSGFIFEKDSILYRQINNCYSEEFDNLNQSGLMKTLQSRGDLINHKDEDIQNAITKDAFRIIRPEFIPFISYPYEWSFSQLKDAALLTLDIQQEALARDMTLKDASAFNIQFNKGRAVFIDTLSFKTYSDGEPWVAYGQFCRHFLAPLALMSYKDVSLNQLLRIHLDGIPLKLTSRILPFWAFFNTGLLIHLLFHSGIQEQIATSTMSLRKIKNQTLPAKKINKSGLNGIIENLKNTIKKLSWKPTGTEWAEYYENTNYTDTAFQLKIDIVSQIIVKTKPKTVWDIGANDGTFSRIASSHDIQVVSFDIDPAAVEMNYLKCKCTGDTKILPLLMDITNPSPGLGWNNEERSSLPQRSGSADLIFALAIIHHLAIGNNLPFGIIVDFFSRICKDLLIEFIPKSDSQIQLMLSSRHDIFSDYDEVNFITCFEKAFIIQCRYIIPETERVIFLMHSKCY